MPKVPVINYPTVEPKRRKPRKAKRIKSDEEIELYLRLKDVSRRLRELKAERVELRKKIKRVQFIKSNGKLPTVKLYALKLENDNWYIGMSYNVNRRFIKHKTGKGANWTKRHRPIEVFEIRQTDFTDQESVASMEDDMTIEYAMRYGSDKVRGGGYCQTKPRWPDVVIQNEMLY